MSDRTWNRLGRRRPYFLAGALLASAALILMPQSSALWMAAGLLWIMDTSINMSMEPFRAFVADLPPEEQRTRGFAMQSLFIGLGAVVASALPWMMTNLFHVQSVERSRQSIPLAVRLSFLRRRHGFLGSGAMDHRQHQGVPARRPGRFCADEAGEVRHHGQRG